MSAKKMLVVMVAKTKAVLGVATRTAGGLPAAQELVGPGLLTRSKDSEVTLAVPVEELEVKEFEYSDGVFRDPASHTVDDTGTIVAPSLRVKSIDSTNAQVTVKLDAGPVAADKAILIVIDAGPNYPPFKFEGKTALNILDTIVPITGVPPDTHPVFASVDGYTSLVVVGNFA